MNVQVRQIIALVGPRGGAGRTTLALRLGMDLVHRERRVTLVDFDPQASLTLACEVDPTSPGTYELLHGHPVEPHKTTVAGLNLIPAIPGLDPAVVSNVSQTTLRASLAAIEPLGEVVLLDTAPGLGPLQLMAVAAADKLVVVSRDAPHWLEETRSYIDRLMANVNVPRKMISAVISAPTSRSTKGLEETLGVPCHVLPWLDNQNVELLSLTGTRANSKTLANVIG